MERTQERTSVRKKIRQRKQLESRTSADLIAGRNNFTDMAKKYRLGGGLQIIENGFFIGPVRDPDAPRRPCCLDISAGLMEPDEGMKATQVREGAEEIVRVRDGKVFLPDIVKEAGVVEQVTSTIAEAIEDPESPFEHGFELDFYPSEPGIPTNTEEVWIQGHSLHDWETGITVEEKNTASYEMVNYLIEDPPEDVKPFDAEVVEGDEENVWLDRFVYKFHPVTGEAKLYRSGEKVFEGSFEKMIDFLEEEFGEQPGSTVKVKAALKGLPPEEKKIYSEEFDETVKAFFNL
ncbi:MAG: hypothetical protein ACI8Z7_000415 [Candidatus Nanohaloarchaea archaeon]|jgi:hypothetical protein